MITPLLLAALLSADADTAKFDDLYKKRDDAAAAEQLGTLASGFKATADYDKLWRAARWYHWVADDSPDDLKKTDGKIGWDAGETAKKANPAGIEAKYWTSACIGDYSLAVGVLKALTQGLESKFRDPLFDAAKADPNCQNVNVDYVGPEMALGRYYDQLPWPKRSVGKAKEWLQKAIAARPEALRAHYYLADAIKGDDKEAAKKELALIAAGDESDDPPEARRVKRWAKTLEKTLTK